MLQGFDRKNSNSWALSRDIDELKYLMKILTMKDSIPISQSPGFSEKHKQYFSLSLSLSLFSLSLFLQFTHQGYLGTTVKKEKYLFLYMVSVETNQEAKNLTLCYSKLTNIPRL